MKLSQEELIHYSPYFTEKQREKYQNQFIKNGRLQTKTMDKIEEDYLQYYEVVHWTKKGKNGEFVFEKQRDEAIYKKDERGNSRTKYGDYIGKNFVYNLLSDENADATHKTKYRWLVNYCGFIPEKFDAYINKSGGIGMTDIMEIDLDESILHEVDYLESEDLNNDKMSNRIKEKYAYYKKRWLTRNVFASLTTYLKYNHDIIFRRVTVGIKIDDNNDDVDENEKYQNNVVIMTKSEERKLEEIVDEAKQKYNIKKRYYWQVKDKAFNKYLSERIKKEIGFDKYWKEEEIIIPANFYQISNEEVTHLKQEIKQLEAYAKEQMNNNWLKILNSLFKAEIRYLDNNYITKPDKISYDKSMFRLYEYYFLSLDNLCGFSEWNAMEKYKELGYEPSYEISEELQEYIDLGALTIEEIERQINSLYGENIIGRLIKKSSK